MSGEENKKATNSRIGFECAKEAEALLNCVTAKNYNEMRCLPLLKKLRACVEKKVGTLPATSSVEDVPPIELMWYHKMCAYAGKLTCAVCTERSGLQNGS
jgi:hypothetical protein